MFFKAFALFSLLALAPATQPATQPSIQQMRDEIKSLRAEIDRLRRDNIDLRGRLAGKRTAAETNPVSNQARDFKPGEYKIFHSDGRTYITKHCESLDDALQYARNMRWQLQVIYDADTGAPIYPGIIPVTEKPPPFELKD